MSAGDAEVAAVLHEHRFAIRYAHGYCACMVPERDPSIGPKAHAAHVATALAPVIEARVAAAAAGAHEMRIRRLHPPEGADLPTWHALHQTVLTIVGGATLAATDATEGEGL